MRHPSLEQARRVIERTQSLESFAYLVHVDRKAIQHSADSALAQWQSQAARSLEQVAGWAGDAQQVCVENLEN